MSCVTRCIVRTVVVGGLALGGATLLVGPERVAAGFNYMRDRAKLAVDTVMDDPIALRQQIHDLAQEYPERIAEVRAEIGNVERQMSEFTRDVGVSQRVLAMTTEDLGQLKTLVVRAKEEQASSTRPVSIRFEGVRFDINEAYAEGRRIDSIRKSFEDRLAQDEFQLKFLGEQKDRLSEILGKLESEYSSFEAQLWQLDRQIDAIHRNERLIELTEKQQETLESFDSMGKVHNLKQLEGKLAQMRLEQEARLQELNRRSQRDDYEDRAVLELEGAAALEDPFDSIDDGEIRLEESAAGSKPMAWADN